MPRDTRQNRFYFYFSCLVPRYLSKVLKFNEQRLGRQPVTLFWEVWG
jgi:hypothetical protein